MSINSGLPGTSDAARRWCAFLGRLAQLRLCKKATTRETPTRITGKTTKQMSKRGGALKIPPTALRLERRMRLAGLCSCVFAATVFGHDPVLAETVGTAISIKTKVAAEQTAAQRVLTVGAGVAQ